MAAANSEVVVVMVPFPEYGHQIPLLRLSQLISSYNISVHYISVGARNHELKQRQQGYDQFLNIQFHDVSISSKEDAEEEDYLSYYESLKQIEDHRTGVGLASRNLFTLREYDPGMLPLCDYIIQQQAHIPSMDSCYKPEGREFIKTLRDCKFKSGEILNTCREIEGPYLDALSKQSETPFWGLGPFNRVHFGDKESCKSHRCIQWLDKQPLNSVILVSFGTANTFSLEQIHMIAIGLEKSEQKFIWVLRESDKRGENVTGVTSNIELPIGFEEGVSERGIIAREWVPQPEILAHPSTGGYFFHSGWNSFLESATMGVPMATWPLSSDNPYNDVLITKVLKVGLVVRDWAHKDELVNADTIEVAVRTLMNSPEGEEMRQRAVKFSEAIKMSIGDGGSTKKEMDSFIAHITR